MEEMLTKIADYKKANDWLAILQLYGLQQLDSPVPADLSADEKCEISFAAKHWVDNLSATKREPERVVRGYLWCFRAAESLVREEPECLRAWQSYAYLCYEFHTAIAYPLGKSIRGLKVERQVQTDFAHYRKTAGQSAVDACQRVLELASDDAKFHYRYASLLEKDRRQSTYAQKNLVTCYAEDGSPLPYKDDQRYAEIKSHYETAIGLIEKMSPAQQKGFAKIHQKAKFGLCRLLNDTQLKCFSLEPNIENVWNGQPLRLYKQTFDGITWNVQEIKNCDTLLKEVMAELNFPTEITAENLAQVAGADTTILPMYIYYRQAKIYYMMRLFYLSGLNAVNKMRHQNNTLVKQKCAHYWELTKTYCQWALEIRLKRRALGFTDAGGIHPEADLLAMLYTLDTNFDIGNLELLAKKSRSQMVLVYY